MERQFFKNHKEKTTEEPYCADLVSGRPLDIKEVLNGILERADSGNESALDECDKAILLADIPTHEQAELLMRVTSSLALGAKDEQSRDDFIDRRVRKIRHEVLPELLGDQVYDRVGRELAQVFKAGQPISHEYIADDAYIETKVPSIGELSPAVRYEVVERFVDNKLLRTGRRNNKEVYALPPNTKRSLAQLSSNLASTSRLAAREYAKANESADVTSFDDIYQLYERHNQARAVSTVAVDVSTKDAYKIMPINELRIGHQDAKKGIELLERELTRIAELPQSEHPDVVLVSNLIQGDFAYSQSKKRPILVGDLASNNAQFAAAKYCLDRIKDTGSQVVHSLGPDDALVALDYTKGVIAEMNGIMKSGEKAGYLPYYEQNRLTQHKLFQEHYKFQLEYMMPLCYRLGRRLRTADEIAALTDGEHQTSEYFLLYQAIKYGAELPPALGVNASDIVKMGERYDDGSVVVHDADFAITTRDKNYWVQYRHSVGLSPESLSANHMATPLQQMGNLGMMGAALPDLFMTGRAQEGVYATSSQVPIVSLPGMTDPSESLQSSAYYSQAPGDPSRRFNATRRRLIKPAIDTIEIKDNGNIVHHFSTGKLMEKSRSIPRMAIFEVCDFQVGSPTARQDLQIKYLSMILDKAAETPVAIHFTGDIIHGNIYANMAHEAQSIGLMRPESQKLALSTQFRRVFNEAPRPLIDAVVDVLVQQGNHDEYQHMKTFGNANHDPNIDYLIRECRDQFETPDTPGKVRHDAVFLADEGTPVATWTGRSHYGDFTINSAHYHIMKGMKGGGGGLPVYHALQRARGIGAAENPDILLGAHWHNEQAVVIGDIVSIVGGALAERSEFEDKLGYDAKVAGTCIEIGGGKPVSVEFIHPKAMIDQQVRYGYFSNEQLSDNGFHDDAGFDPYKHGLFSFDYLPKSALQKAVLKMNREASERVEYESTVRNPNRYDDQGNPVELNRQTKRLFEAAERLEGFAN